MQMFKRHPVQTLHNATLVTNAKLCQQRFWPCHDIRLNLVKPSAQYITVSGACMQLFVKCMGILSGKFDKSKVFNLRCQKVCLQYKLYLKFCSQGINDPLDPLGGQKI